MSKHLTRLMACSALLAATGFAGSALAGEELFIATVCDDRGAESSEYTSTDKLASCEERYKVSTTYDGYGSALDDFYLSNKEYQYTHYNDDDAFTPDPSYAPFAKGEYFTAPTPLADKDYCDYYGYYGYGTYDRYLPTNKTAGIRKGRGGVFTWGIVLPKDLEGNFNIAIQCAVLKPNTTNIFGCAAQTGELLDFGFCNMRTINPGQNTINPNAVGAVSATAYPGYYTRGDNSWTPFALTPYRTPTTLGPADGTFGTLAIDPSFCTTNCRVPLKACLTETVYMKMPVQGQVNGDGQVEQDLFAGDFLVVKYTVPRANTVDIYCHAQSVKITGIGRCGTLIPNEYYSCEGDI